MHSTVPPGSPWPVGCAVSSVTKELKDLSSPPWSPGSAHLQLDQPGLFHHESGVMLELVLLAL